MKRKILILLSAISLSGCASSVGKPVEVVTADRAGGIVTVGFVHNENLPLTDDGSKARWEDAVEIASNVCRKWGYDHSEVLTPHARMEGMRNMYGQLMNGSITKQYQCIGGNVK
ncbi:TPA: hypothetical protein PXO06_002607 [Yersinia enterocolitica]|uniref:hypothetical protein n=1 Tax=Yersinia TaxID=629 RepID=UPI00263B8B1D|nr:hypothetical protein [Yersinia sp. 22-579]EKN3568134.1 hypothetical protein [Yersinia enterocolitica]EKN3637450.1 hypothetical protein [Yersinia enterocolitica]EKN4742968.1 hypothetical protein [Yersinia enterocolitica]EKN4762623.1 hypothetical protein [Yersinia enterocolitica]EKN4837313.1 hypothetical protein [Yersinia enterocolitica]